MLDANILGKRILERRKAQGLTQEQLGAELGVSGQSVSKWENGETIPDLGIVPSICKVLEISADALLDIDGGVGIDSLSRELSKRIYSQKSPNDALMQTLASLHRGSDGPRWNPDTDVSFDFKNRRLIGMDFWDSKGVAIFVKEAVLAVDTTSEQQINGIRILVAPNNWEVAQYLLNGPAKEKALMDAEIVENADTLRLSLSEMIDAGVVTLDREGYKLDDRWGLIWACAIKALTYKIGLGGQQYNWNE